MGPPPPPPPRFPERDPPDPLDRRETVELSTSDDPCPGPFGTEQPEPVVIKAIYHYTTRVGHFTAPISETDASSAHRPVGSIS